MENIIELPFFLFEYYALSMWKLYEHAHYFIIPPTVIQRERERALQGDNHAHHCPPYYTPSSSFSFWDNPKGFLIANAIISINM